MNENKMKKYLNLDDSKKSFDDLMKRINKGKGGKPKPPKPDKE